jgi:hypothetical protein
MDYGWWSARNGGDRYLLIGELAALDDHVATRIGTS